MYEDWIAKAHAIEQTGLTARTLERMVKDGKLQRAYVHVPGRKSLPVFHPVEIQQLVEKTLKPAPVAKQKATSKTTPPSVVIIWSVADKEYLTLREAAWLKGVPLAYLKRKVRNGEIPAGKLGGWRIHRDVLRQHQVMSLLLPAPPQLLNGTREEIPID